MKLTANIKLLPDENQFVTLKETLERVNQACNYISDIAFNNNIFKQFSLHKKVYHDVKEKFNLSAQMTVRSIAKVSNSYKINKKVKHIFKSHSAQPYDERIFKLCKDTQVSIWTLTGRQKITFQCGEYQQKLIENQCGEVDLMFVRESFYIAIVCDIDEDALINPKDILGIDLGVCNLAVDSTGESYTGKEIDKYRKRFNNRRKNLQKKGTKAAKRKLKKISGKQQRFQKDVNHCVSKAIVTKAKRYNLGISLENLKGIRKGIKARKSGRARLHNWGFYQLKSFIEYKAKRLGIPIFFVDPKHTSQKCPKCGHVSKNNRPNRDLFKCESCSFSHESDYVAALNIKAKAFLNMPMVEAT